jgi:membrane protease YdiL (CAAX protease family)
VHLNLPALLPIFVVGLFLAFLYHRTGSVFPGIVAHAFNNTIAFIVLYFAL